MTPVFSLGMLLCCWCCDGPCRCGCMWGGSTPRPVGSPPAPRAPEEPPGPAPACPCPWLPPCCGCACDPWPWPCGPPPAAAAAAPGSAAAAPSAASKPSPPGPAGPGPALGSSPICLASPKSPSLISFCGAVGLFVRIQCWPLMMPRPYKNELIIHMPHTCHRGWFGDK